MLVMPFLIASPIRGLTAVDPFCGCPSDDQGSGSQRAPRRKPVQGTMRYRRGHASPVITGPHPVTIRLGGLALSIKVPLMSAWPLT